MNRTLILKLNPTPEQEPALLQALVGFTQAFNFLCHYGWEHKLKNNVKLQRECYYSLKELIPAMPAQLFIAATHKAAEALKSAFSRLKNGRKAHQPKSRLCPIRYDMRSYWVKWDKAQASLATPQGRLVLGFTVPEYARKYTGFPTASADLIYRKGRFWLHVVISLPDKQYQNSGETIGIDLGLNHPAVTSKRKFLGKRHWKEIDRRNFRLKRALQSKGHPQAGTRSAKKHLKKLGGRLQRFRRDCDHVLSKRIVENASPGTTLVIENLTEIRSRVKQKSREARRRLHSWSFAQFRSFLAYKAEERGMQVVAIDPGHTSQTCSRCGYQYRHNRKSQALFCCRRCGYSLNADLNASYNIRDKHLATLGTSLGSGLPSYSLSSRTSVQGQATPL